MTQIWNPHPMHAELYFLSHCLIMAGRCQSPGCLGMFKKVFPVSMNTTLSGLQHWGSNMASVDVTLFSPAERLCIHLSLSLTGYIWPPARSRLCIHWMASMLATWANRYCYFSSSGLVIVQIVLVWTIYSYTLWTMKLILPMVEYMTVHPGLILYIDLLLLKYHVTYKTYWPIHTKHIDLFLARDNGTEFSHAWPWDWYRL